MVKVGCGQPKSLGEFRQGSNTMIGGERHPYVGQSNLMPQESDEGGTRARSSEPFKKPPPRKTPAGKPPARFFSEIANTRVFPPVASFSSSPSVSLIRLRGEAPGAILVTPTSLVVSSCTDVT